MNKKDDGQQRRLQGLLEKRRFEEERRKLVSETLRNGAVQSKKIVFKDSDDEDEEPKSKSSRPILFDDDDDPDLTEQNPDDLLKNRFSGVISQKLTEMESRFGHDGRFKVDDRFAEESDEEKPEDTERKTEKKTQLAILSNILGHDVKSAVVDKKQTDSYRPFQRFDPDDEEHLKWMNDQRDKLKIQNKPLFDADQFNKELDKESTKVIEGQFYEVDDTFAKELQEKMNAKQPESFSFLSMIGRPDTSASKSESIFKKLLDTETEPTHSQPIKTELPTSSPLTTVEKPFFFIHVNDMSFRRVVDSFRRQQPMDKVWSSWNGHREKTMKYYKSMHKSRVRINELEKKKKLRQSYSKRASHKNNSIRPNESSSDESD